MSCISVHGWKAVVAAACLLGLAEGCHVPPVPAGASPQMAPDAEKEDGWLYNRLTGKKTADSRTEGSVAGKSDNLS